MAAFIPTVADKNSVFRLIGQVILVCEGICQVKKFITFLALKLGLCAEGYIAVIFNIMKAFKCSI